MTIKGLVKKVEDLEKASGATPGRCITLMVSASAERPPEGYDYTEEEALALAPLKIGPDDLVSITTQFTPDPTLPRVVLCVPKV
jgi:hypothetical protein